MLKRLAETELPEVETRGAFMMSGRFGMALAAAVVLQAASVPAADLSLDYEFFKNRVEPIFLKKRDGHARCYVCHSDRSGNAFRLEKLTSGSASWTDEQSRRNFQLVSALVVPSDPAQSRLLLYPLAPEAGGNSFHSGGRQFSSPNDPEWKIIAQWVQGQKQAAPAGK